MRVKIIELVVVLMSLITVVQSFGQTTHIDSLKQLLSDHYSRDNFELLLKLVDAYTDANFDSGLYYAGQALKLARYYRDNEMIAKGLEHNALLYYSNNQYDKAIQFFKNEIVLHQKEENGIQEGRALIDIGLAFSQKGQLDSALEYYNQAYSVYLKIDDAIGQIQAMNRIAITQRRLGNLEVALEFHLKALRMAEQHDEKTLAANTNNDIGVIYRLLGDADNALHYFNLAYSTYSELNDTAKFGVLFNNIGSVFYMNNQKDSALVYFLKSLESNIAQHNWVFVSQIQSNISRTYLELGQPEKAIEYSAKSIAMNRKYGFKRHLINNYLNLGLIYSSLPDTVKANAYYDSGIALAKETKMVNKLPSLYKAKYETARDNNDFENALKYYKEFRAWKDSIISQQTKNQLADIQTKYETEKIKQENQALKINELKNERKEFRFLVLIAFLSLVTLFLIIVLVIKLRASKKIKSFYLKEKELNETLTESAEKEKKYLEEVIYAEKKINELQKEKIHSKNRELTALLMNMKKRTDIINDIEEKIETLQQQKVISAQDIDSVRSILEGNHHPDESWNEFQVQINQIFPGFFEKLKKRVPELTQHDLRLCAYLLSDMKTKEIAAILNVTEAAVIKHKQRLRKKFNFNSNEELINYLRLF